MAVLTRSALESSPLADLHEIASELGIDGFRRLRKAALVDTILGRQDPDGPGAAGGGEPAATEAAPIDDDGTEVVASARTRARARAKPAEEAKPADDAKPAEEARS